MGIKHCGKSTQARLLSRHYSVPSFDTDDLITEITGKTPREIYSSEGKEAFMKAIEKGIDQTSFKQIEILYKSSGAPTLTYQNHEYEISISHDGDYAVAIVKL